MTTEVVWSEGEGRHRHDHFPLSHNVVPVPRAHGVFKSGQSPLMLTALAGHDKAEGSSEALNLYTGPSFSAQRCSCKCICSLSPLGARSRRLPRRNVCGGAGMRANGFRPPAHQQNGQAAIARPVGAHTQANKHRQVLAQVRTVGYKT